MEWETKLAFGRRDVAMPRPDPDPDPVPVPVSELELVPGAVVGGGVGATVVVGGLLLDLEKLLLRIPERSEVEGDEDGEERFSRVLDLSSLPESWALALALVVVEVELTLGSGCGRSASVGGTQKQQAEHAPPGRRCGSDALAGERQAGTRPEQECWDGSGDEAGGRQRPRGEQQQQQQWGFRKNDGREQAQQATSRRSGPGTARRAGRATAAKRTTTTRAGAFCVD